jgi:hypothetical protein
MQIAHMARSKLHQKAAILSVFFDFTSQKPSVARTSPMEP